MQWFTVVALGAMVRSRGPDQVSQIRGCAHLHGAARGFWHTLCFNGLMEELPAQD